ncbi:MAG: hypothetical protein IJY04_01505 [Clostridia bacterium]|nr:hypothetical protein [Clostridia bacterium]
MSEVELRSSARQTPTKISRRRKTLFSIMDPDAAHRPFGVRLHCVPLRMTRATHRALLFVRATPFTQR